MCALLHTLFKSYFKKYEDRWKHLIWRKLSLEQILLNSSTGHLAELCRGCLQLLLGGILDNGGPLLQKSSSFLAGPFPPQQWAGFSSPHIPSFPQMGAGWALPESVPKGVSEQCRRPVLSGKQGSLCSLWGCRDCLLSKHPPVPATSTFFLPNLNSGFATYELCGLEKGIPPGLQFPDL